MDNFLYRTHAVRCIICGPSSSGKSVFLTNLILNTINEHEKIYIHSPFLHEDINRKLYQSFSNYIPNNLIRNILNEKEIDLLIEEKVKNKDFQKSDTEIE